MQIVLVDWLINKGSEDDFKSYWRSALPINDRSQMIGEFLSEPTGHGEFPWVTWDLRADDAGRPYEATRFTNVGLWADTKSFHDQVGRYFNPAKGKLDFEFKLRRRALLTPACWRMGDWKLPAEDSEGVV